MTHEIGRKIQFFRKRANLSQLALETKIGASTGSISRIENGVVNPTKETIDRISEVLKLNFHEYNYLLNREGNEPTPEEIENARKEVKNLFEKITTLAYVLDYQDRIVYLSKGFRVLAKLEGFDPNVFLYKALNEIIFNPEIGFRRILPKEKFDQIALPVLTRWVKNRRHAVSEKWAADLIKHLEQFDDFKRLNEIAKKEEVDVYSEEARTLEFKILGMPLSMIYTLPTLHNDRRFTIVHYKIDITKTPKKVLNLIGVNQTVDAK